MIFFLLEAGTWFSTLFHRSTRQVRKLPTNLLQHSSAFCYSWNRNPFWLTAKLLCIIQLEFQTKAKLFLILQQQNPSRGSETDGAKKPYGTAKSTEMVYKVPKWFRLGQTGLVGDEFRIWNGLTSKVHCIPMQAQWGGSGIPPTILQLRC